MTRGRLGLPLLAYAVLIIAWIYQTRVYIPQLPEIVVSHFDFSGNPDGNMSREGFRSLSLLVQGSMASVFLLLSFLLPRIPASMISIPHSGYWLADDQREASLAFLQRSMLWMGALTFAATLMIFQSTIRANLGEVIVLGRSFWISMGFYIGAIALLLVKLYERFKRPDESMSA